MITVREAETLIQNELLNLPAQILPITECSGKILRSPVKADRDFPAFDRVVRDGIAIRFDAWEMGIKRFEVAGIQPAGHSQQTLKDGSHCIEIMTGAMCPIGADTIIMYEDIEWEEAGTKKYALIRQEEVVRGQHLHMQGSDRQKGDLLIPPGTLLGGAEIGVAATVGKTHLAICQPPRVAIISTGDELVDISAIPLPHQIRKSNVYVLSAALESLGIRAERIHLPDSPEFIYNQLSQIRETHPIWILTGGVSKGKKDYVPQVLAQLGIREIFHKIKQRPGKPFWFGRSPNGTPIVFALPGNPVSSFMCFYRYVRPWLLSTLGSDPIPPLYASLLQACEFAPKLTYFMQVQTHLNEWGQLGAIPLEGGGSGDHANLLECNGFLELPCEKDRFWVGEVYPFIPFRNWN